MGRQSAAIAFVLVTTLLAGCVTDGGGRGTAGGADAFHAGVSAMLRGDLDEAVAQYSRALESAPTPEAQAQVHQARAATYYRMGEPDKALADADAVIRLRPDLADAYSLRGQILQAKGQPDLALNDLEIAVRLKPEARNYGNRGFGRMALGQLDAALEDFNEAIRLKPRYAEAYLGRGTYYLRNRDYRAAIGQFDQVIQLSPEHASAYNLRGNSYAYLGEYERSISDFDVAILFQPRYAEAFSNRGMMRYVQGDLKGDRKSVV